LLPRRGFSRAAAFSQLPPPPLQSGALLEAA